MENKHKLHFHLRNDLLINVSKPVEIQQKGVYKKEFEAHKNTKVLLK